MEDIIRKAIEKVETDRATKEDKVIVSLFEQCNDLKLQLKSTKTSVEDNEDIPVHKATPWYMQS